MDAKRGFIAVLVWIHVLFFIGYGLAFTVAPEMLSALVTDSVPSTVSGRIDLRATYGGLCLGAGLVLALLAFRAATLRLGLLAVGVIVLAMALGRGLGLYVEGEGSPLMWRYLVTELIDLALVFWALCLDWHAET